MTFSKDLKPRQDGATLYTSRDLYALQAEIDALKRATADLENKLADMADLTETGTLKATNAVQTDQLSANLAVLGTAVVENELAVSNGSGNDKDVIVNRNGVPEWGPPTDINAIDVLVCDTVARATTVDHSGTVNTTDAVTQADSVTHADDVDHADNVTTLDSATTVNHADTIVDADNVTGADTVASAAIVTSANTVDSASTVTGATTVDNASTVTGATAVDHADTVTSADVATNVTTAANISTVENVTTCDTVTNTTTVTNADTVTDADTVAHADLVQVADVIQQTGDVSIVGNLAVTGDITQGADTLDNTYIKLTEKGAVNGVATLDSTGRIPASQLTIDAMEYKGKWDASTNTPTLADGTGTDGDFYIVSVAGSQDLGSGTITYNLNDRVLYNGSEWERVPAGQVDSVNGATGDVVLTGNDIKTSTTSLVSVMEREQVHLYVQGQGADATKIVDGYFSGSGIALITFDVNNAYTGGVIKLTISGSTYDLYIDGEITSATNHNIPKGTYVLIKGYNSWNLSKDYNVQGAYTCKDANYANTAGHATSADSATTAAQSSAATTAQYSRIANNQYYTSTTAAATPYKTISETISGTVQEGTTITLKFSNANSANNPYITIGSTNFNLYINNVRVSSSSNSWIYGVIYRATFVSFSGDYNGRGRIDLEVIKYPALQDEAHDIGDPSTKRYMRLSNGLKVAWGVTSANTSGSASNTNQQISFPSAAYFASAPLVIATKESSNANSGYCNVSQITTDDFLASYTYASKIHWLAIGY